MSASIRLQPIQQLGGTVRLPGDKSISHRSLILGAIAKGVTEVTGLLDSADVRSTESCLRSLGVEFVRHGNKILIHGRGLHGLRSTDQTLDCGNSGTTTRILMGLLAGQSFRTKMTGDESIQKRPMKRAAEPLRRMGARIDLTRNEFAPMVIHGTPLQGIHYDLQVASAQVKTALLLAGLYAHGDTTLGGQIASRDHTERMLPHFGVKLDRHPESLTIRPGQTLEACSLQIPGDPSSAAFWMGAACMAPQSTLQILDVSLNPTRTGLMTVLSRMGAVIEQEVTVQRPEPIGNLRISVHGLRGTVVRPEEIPSLIDEIPLLAVVASQAEGETVVQGAQELRVKESDRIEAIAANLRAMGIELTTFEDGFSIRGPQTLKGATVDSFLDHRIAMAFAIASMKAKGTTEILRPECVNISYPDFFEVLKRISHD